MARYAQQQQLSVDELRMQLSQHLRSSSAFSDTVYQDQPIIMTGAQLKSFVPDAIRQARQISRTPGPHWGSTAATFYEQARLLAGYEDDFEFAGEFSHYYPTYEDMSNEQLRGYFTWRTKVRHGAVEKTSLSFAYVYIYELINLIGVDSAQQGYEALRSFASAYWRHDARLARYLETWIDDFVVYYGLDANLLDGMSFAENDAAFEVLEHQNTRSESEIFSALRKLSSYPIMESSFYMEHAPELEQLVVYAYETVALHHDKKLKTSLSAKLSGRMQTERYFPFQRAVFADPLGISNAQYQVSSHDTIYCRNGAWFRTRFASLEHPLRWVSDLLETCESLLRDAYAYPNMLGCPIKTKYIVKAIQDMAAAIVATARTRREREVHIDFGSLDHIRKAADITCEKLIVEEEGDFTQGSICDSFSQGLIFDQPAQATDAPRADHRSAPTQSLLNAEESALLELLLNGGSVRDFEREHACIASVLIDSINEKLYDEFADICIDICGDTPQIIEDYAEELEALI